MKLFYYDNTGSCTSLIAAYIHLKILSDEKAPSVAEIMRINGFADNHSKSQGIPLKIGTDQRGNEIFAIGFGKDHQLALQVIYNLLKDRGLNDWRFFNVGFEMNLLMTVSGFFSPMLHLHRFSRYLAARKIKNNYRKIVAAIQQIKEWTD
jgi:hypothetical protein